MDRKLVVRVIAMIMAAVLLLGLVVMPAMAALAHMQLLLL